MAPLSGAIFHAAKKEKNNSFLECYSLSLQPEKQPHLKLFLQA